MGSIEGLFERLDKNKGGVTDLAFMIYTGNPNS